MNNNIDEQLFNLIINSEKEDVNLVKELLDKGELDVNWIKPFNEKRDHLETVKMMIEYGYSFDVLDCYNLTLVHNAASLGHTSMLNLFLDKGADPNGKPINSTLDDNTPLSFGIITPIRDVNPNSTTTTRTRRIFQYYTPLLVAIKHCQYKTTKILLKRGAIPNLEHPYYFLLSNVSDILIWGSYKILELILRYGSTSLKVESIRFLEIIRFNNIVDYDKKMELLKIWPTILDLHTLTLRSVPKSVLKFKKVD